MPDYTDVPAVGEINEEKPIEITDDRENENMEGDLKKVDINDETGEVPKDPKVEIEKEDENRIPKMQTVGSNGKIVSESAELGKAESVLKLEDKQKIEISDNLDNNDSKRERKDDHSEATGKKDNEISETKEPEDVEMIEDDEAVLETFRTTRCLLEGLSPCKDTSGHPDRKDSPAAHDNVSDDIHANDTGAKLNMMDKLMHESMQIDKAQTTMPSETRLSEIQTNPSQNPATITQEQIAKPPAGPFGSAVGHYLQKDISLIKSSSFGFTPSALSEIPAPVSVPTPFVSSPLSTVGAGLSSVTSPLSAPVPAHSLGALTTARSIAQDHGYTTSSIGILPVPNLQISVTQSATIPGNVKLSPILSACLTSPPGPSSFNSAPSSQTSSPCVPHSQSPLMRQNSGGFGSYSTTGNIQTGSEIQHTNNLNIPVTQSLQKSLDSGSATSSLFIVDFEEHSPGGRKGQKRKRISTATEEIMMYGKRRSTRVGFHNSSLDKSEY